MERRVVIPSQIKIAHPAIGGKKEKWGEEAIFSGKLSKALKSQTFLKGVKHQ